MPEEALNPPGKNLFYRRGVTCDARRLPHSRPVVAGEGESCGLEVEAGVDIDQVVSFEVRAQVAPADLAGVFFQFFGWYQTVIRSC